MLISMEQRQVIDILFKRIHSGINLIGLVKKELQILMLNMVLANVIQLHYHYQKI